MIARDCVVRWLCSAVLVLVVAGCTSTQPPGEPPPGGPPPSNQAGPLPAECTSTITDPGQAGAALARAQPGTVVCLSGNGLTNAELEVTTSGTRDQPITVIGDGATMRTMNVKADYVVIQGLTLRDGDGLTMEGRGLVARNNVIYNATADGLVCRVCVDTIIESNTVQRADGTGINIAGERITARNNTVSDSILRTGGDADGFRFFGVGHLLTGNTIKDIKSSGYDDEGPHTDCFQTYQSRGEMPTYDVVIADNICTNVDVQCLIATVTERGARLPPEGRTAITFERNTCSVGGSQAVLLESFPHVIVRDNTFSGARYRAVFLSNGATNCAVIGNTVTGGLRLYEIDEESEPGFRESGNTSR